MPPKTLLKYILDIEILIAELEQLVDFVHGDFMKFSSNFMALRTAERDRFDVAFLYSILETLFRCCHTLVPFVLIQKEPKNQGLGYFLPSSFQTVSSAE